MAACIRNRTVKHHPVPKETVPRASTTTRNSDWADVRSKADRWRSSRTRLPPSPRRIPWSEYATGTVPSTTVSSKTWDPRSIVVARWVPNRTARSARMARTGALDARGSSLCVTLKRSTPWESAAAPRSWPSATVIPAVATARHTSAANVAKGGRSTPFPRRSPPSALDPGVPAWRRQVVHT